MANLTETDLKLIIGEQQVLIRKLQSDLLTAQQALAAKDDKSAPKKKGK